MLEAACWAHVRRKFFDLAAAGPAPIAEEALRRIAELYAVEDRIRGAPPDKRCRVCTAEAVPRVDAMKAWLETQLARVPAKSATAQAIRYALARWTALRRYLDDRRIEIDNNAAERAIRPVALGRNYAHRVIVRSSPREAPTAPTRASAFQHDELRIIQRL